MGTDKKDVLARGTEGGGGRCITGVPPAGGRSGRQVVQGWANRPVVSQRARGDGAGGGGGR